MDRVNVSLKYIVIMSLILLTCSAIFSLTKKRITKESNTIRVLSYNIHYGVGTDSKKDLKRIADVINKLDPDIVGLQEVHDSTMVAELSKLTNMQGVFGPSMKKEPPNLYRLLDIPIPESQLFYGDGILSKYPLKYIGNVFIPSASSSRYEAMCASIDVSHIYGKDISVRFLTTHFDYLETIGSQLAREATVEVIERAFFNDSLTLPAILTGDFNVTPQSDPIKLLEKKGWVYENLNKDLFTVPVKNPNKQIDYVLPRPKSSWKIVDVEVINESIASDHLPILMILELITN